MPKDSRTEAALDAVLAEALLGDSSFATWFLEQTKFRGRAAECVFCRSNNPWSAVELPVENAVTGDLETLIRQCETDVLAVYRASDGSRLALHIENKLANGSFTHKQPELYEARKQQWKHREKLGAYTDATTVLVAPEVFRLRNAGASAVFDAFVSHEAIGRHLAPFATGFPPPTV